jgi:hypothetical protein
MSAGATAALMKLDLPLTELNDILDSVDNLDSSSAVDLSDTASQLQSRLG